MKTINVFLILLSTTINCILQPVYIPLHLHTLDDDQRYLRLVANFTFGTYLNPVPFQSEGRIQFTTMDVQGILVGEQRANKTLDLDAPFLYDMSKSLTVSDISNGPEDF